MSGDSDIFIIIWIYYYCGTSILYESIPLCIIFYITIVKWNKVNDSLPTTYIVTWTSERDHIVKSPGLVGLTSYAITGLTLDAVYTITVVAHNSCGAGPKYKTTISLSASTNPNGVITTAITSSSTSTNTNIVMYPTSAVNPAATSTTDEISKISSNSICYIEY